MLSVAALLLRGAASLHVVPPSALRTKRMSSSLPSGSGGVGFHGDDPRNSHAAMQVWPAAAKAIGRGSAMAYLPSPSTIIGPAGAEPPLRSAAGELGAKSATMNSAVLAKEGEQDKDARRTGKGVMATDRRQAVVRVAQPG